MADGTFPTLMVTQKGRDVLLGKSAVARKEALQAAAVTENDELFELLRRLRKEIATEQGVPPFVVFSDQTLKEMSAKLPKTDQDLLSVKGVGEQKKIEIRSSFFRRNPKLCKRNRVKKKFFLEICTLCFSLAPEKSEA